MMNTDSKLFLNTLKINSVPLYEAKMFWHFDHRWGDYANEARTTGRGLAETSLQDYQNPNYQITPRYWVDKSEVENRLYNRCNKEWLIAFRDVTSSKLVRTCVCSVLPKVAVGHKAPLIFIDNTTSLISCFIANFNSLVFDYIARQKVGGTSLSFFILKQLPIIPPKSYSPQDIEYISQRVLELTYTAWDMKPFAEDLWRELGNSEVGNSVSSTPHSPLPTPCSLRRKIIQNWETNHGKSVSTELQRLIGVARGNESSRDELSTDSSISQGRDLRNDITNSESSSLDSREHSRGIRQGESGGIHSISENSSGFSQRTGDPSDSFGKSQDHSTSADQSSTKQSRNPWENVTFFNSQTSEQQVGQEILDWAIKEGIL